jgi:oligoendopeptidase F
MLTAAIEKRPRTFLPKDFQVNTWEELSPYFNQLYPRTCNSVEELTQWLHQRDELLAVLSENLAWRYIRMTCDTANPDHVAQYTYFLDHIQPQLALFENWLQQQYYTNPFRSQLSIPGISIMDASIAKELEIFEQANIPLFSEVQKKAQLYSALMGKMTIVHDGKELTMQQANALLQSQERDLRKEVFEATQQRRLEDKVAIDSLFSEMLGIRHQIAKNTRFASYTDYRFKELGRFDYTKADCAQFHEAIEVVIKPLYVKLLALRKERLSLAELKPYDLKVDIWADKPLRPFTDGQSLIDRSIALFQRMHPVLGEMIQTMAVRGHFDVESRVGKAPGGYNYPLFESGIPFIFMNAAGQQSDVKTMVHECGHAFHAFATHELPLVAFKDTPSEVAELASMSMELMTMGYWAEFYPDRSDLVRAQLQQLTSIISILPWIATIDAFQTWVYDNPNHRQAEREAQWKATYERFHGTSIDWSSYQAAYATQWQMQSHLFEVPFYYIEYGIAQLGALQLWRNYLNNPEEALNSYFSALELGYTASIPKIYEAAGISFNFSAGLLAELAQFIELQVNTLVEELNAIGVTAD